MQIVAERAFTSRSTLRRVESGDPGVSIGIYAAVLHTLGLLEGLRNTAHINNDEVGQALASAALPKCARSSRHNRH